MPASSASATATRAGRLFHFAAACVRASRASAARASPSPGCELTTPCIPARRQRTTQGRYGSRPCRGSQVSSRMAPSSQVSNSSLVLLAKIGLTADSMPPPFGIGMVCYVNAALIARWKMEVGARENVSCPGRTAPPPQAPGTPRGRDRLRPVMSSSSFGGQSMVAPLRRVLVRRPDEAFGGADPAVWHYTSRPDLAAARREHDALVAILRAAGAEVIEHAAPQPQR